MLIYADNAATTKLDEDAFEAMKPYLMAQYGNASQPYMFARPAKKALLAARESVASCIGAQAEEIFFTSCGTESDNWAIKSMLFNKEKTKKVITTQIEHHAILNACRSLEETGIHTDYLPVNKEGLVVPQSLENIISNDTALVSVMMANNEVGTIEPIKELGKITHSHGALFHTDAVQAVGHIPINVKELDVDMLSASAHKFNGMKGTGFLYVKKGLDLHPFLDGGAQEHSKRAGTENVAGIVAMATALKKNCQQMELTTKKLHEIENAFIQQLTKNKVDFIRNGAKGHLPGNVSISIKDASGEMLLHRLDLKGICVSTGSACDSANTQISHVIKAIKVPREYAEGTIRVSFGVNNTEEEAIVIARALVEIIGIVNNAVVDPLNKRW